MHDRGLQGSCALDVCGSIRVDLVEVLLDEVGQLACKFNACGPTTDHHDMQQPAALRPCPACRIPCPPHQPQRLLAWVLYHRCSPTHAARLAAEQHLLCRSSAYPSGGLPAVSSCHQLTAMYSSLQPFEPVLPCQQDTILS